MGVSLLLTTNWYAPPSKEIVGLLHFAQVFTVRKREQSSKDVWFSPVFLQWSVSIADLFICMTFMFFWHYQEFEIHKKNGRIAGWEPVPPRWLHQPSHHMRVTPQTKRRMAGDCRGAQLLRW